MVLGSDGRSKLRITCFRCSKKGHFADFYPDIETGQQHVEVREQHHVNSVIITEEGESTSNDKSVITTFQYLQIINNKMMKSVKLNKDSVLIDTGSNCSVFNCKKMIVNVKNSDTNLRTYTNSGHQESNL